MHVAGQALVGRADLAPGRRARRRVVMVNAVARARADRAVREPAGADLRALQVDEDADRAPGGVARLAHVVVDPLVVGVVAVARLSRATSMPALDELAEVLGRATWRGRACRRSWRDACAKPYRRNRLHRDARPPSPAHHRQRAGSPASDAQTSSGRSVGLIGRGSVRLAR